MRDQEDHNKYVYLFTIARMRRSEIEGGFDP